jgi:hypothetical protein
VWKVHDVIVVQRPIQRQTFLVHHGPYGVPVHIRISPVFTTPVSYNACSNKHSAPVTKFTITSPAELNIIEYYKISMLCYVDPIFIHT